MSRFQEKIKNPLTVMHKLKQWKNYVKKCLNYSLLIRLLSPWIPLCMFAGGLSPPKSCLNQLQCLPVFPLINKYISNIQVLGSMLSVVDIHQCMLIIFNFIGEVEYEQAILAIIQDRSLLNIKGKHKEGIINIIRVNRGK